jgi:[ribosomal protein S5]-alanine N-acetyltransferase
MPLIELSTPRFYLRSLSHDDLNAIFRLRSNEDVNRYLDREPARSMEDAAAFVERIHTAVANGNSYYWVISPKESNVFTGSAALWNMDDSNSSAEIGYELLPEWQGKAIMQEVLPAVIDYAFGVLKLSTITAECHANNIRSIRLLGKLKFVLDSTSDEMNHYTLHKISDPENQSL